MKNLLFLYEERLQITSEMAKDDSRRKFWLHVQDGVLLNLDMRAGSSQYLDGTGAVFYRDGLVKDERHA